MIGTRLGHYEITGKLGEGGMGVVYRAKDSQLGREVAIKVLPEGVSADPERLARFEREAKVLASLNHANIAQIYGLETGGESAARVRALVMELVEGPTLDERLAGGALPVAEALTIARQIAEALEQAHARGVVHRDLKPQNVKLAGDGGVKVLDFGLAKAMDPVDASGSGAPSTSPTLMNSPTITAAGTQLGVILGTAAYMAPEQARGGMVDARADIWAFGVVLWEMLSGRRLFAAESVPDTLAGVLRAEIDLGALPATTPPAIRRLLRRCLVRNPKNRLHDIADARIVLDEVLRGESDEAAAAPAAVPAPARPAWQTAVALAGAALLGALALFAILRGSAPAPPAPRVVRFDIAQPKGLPIAGAPKISPDGRHIAYAARDDKGIARVWLRSLDSSEARPLAGTEGVKTEGRPFWSPDSRHVGYFTSDTLFKVPIDGGPPQKISDAVGADASWSEQGAILFDGSADAPILGVPAAGGVSKVVVASGDGKEHELPGRLAAVPAGRRALPLRGLRRHGERGRRLDGRRRRWQPAAGRRRPVARRVRAPRLAPVRARDDAGRAAARPGERRALRRADPGRRRARHHQHRARRVLGGARGRARLPRDRRRPGPARLLRPPGRARERAGRDRRREPPDPLARRPLAGLRPARRRRQRRRLAPGPQARRQLALHLRAGGRLRAGLLARRRTALLHARRGQGAVRDPLPAARLGRRGLRSSPRT